MGFLGNFAAGFNAAREAGKKQIVVEKVTFDNPYEKDQMLAVASLYALERIKDAQFRSLLQGDTIEVELQGGWKSNLVEPGYEIDENDHILLECNADKKQKKEFAEERILCTTSVPPAKVNDSKALGRYDLFFKYESLFKQIFSDDTSKKERKALVEEAMGIFYPAYKTFDTDKKRPVVNQQPQYRPDEPVLKEFNKHGYMTIMGMLNTTVEGVLAMKLSDRAVFLEDMETAAENLAVRHKYLEETVSREAAKGTKSSKVWSALQWYFKDADPDKVDAILEMKEKGISVQNAAKYSGLSADDVSEIVTKYQTWKQQNKKGKKGQKQQKQQTPSPDGTDPESGSNKPYAGLTAEGFFAELIVSKGLANVDPSVAQEILLEMKDKIPNFGNMGEDCPIQGIYAILLAYVITGDIQEDTGKLITDALLSSN